MALTYPRDTEYARLQAQADAADREFMEAIFILTGKLDRWEVTETERRYPMIAARRAAKIAADRALCDYVAGIPALLALDAECGGRLDWHYTARGVMFRAPRTSEGWADLDRIHAWAERLGLRGPSTTAGTGPTARIRARIGNRTTKGRAS